jgi:beta-lactamase regulating signal transducer with metallopeptidase domain
MNAVLHALAPYQSAALALVAYLVTSLWIGATVTALAMLVVRFWKPLDAAARYAVWYVALIAVVLGPIVTSAGMQRGWHGGTVTQQLGAPAGDVRFPHAPLRYALRVERPAIALPPYLAFGAAALWLLIVLGGAARFGAGTVVLARLKRDALPLAPERRAALPLWRTYATAERARHVRLCVSDRVEVPVAVGLFDGMVVLPQHVLDAFEPSDVDRFVLHELAHLERRDDWTTVVQRLIQMVMFFNPAVHVIARRLDLEREIACDDRVIEATSDVRSYAVGLTRMAESTAWPHRGIAAPAIFITRHQLSLRVEELLTRPRSAARRFAIAPAVVALAASLGVVAAAAPLAPTVGFGSAPAADARAFTQIRTEMVLVDRNGKRTTIDEKRLGVGVMVVRGDEQTVTELRALDPGSATQFHALLKKIHDDKLAPASAAELLRTFQAQHSLH